MLLHVTQGFLTLSTGQNAFHSPVCNAAIKVSVLHALKDPLGV